MHSIAKTLHNNALCVHVWTFDWSIFSSGKILRPMWNVLFLACDESPTLTQGMANLHQASKKIRDQTCQLITVPAPFYQNKLSN